MVLGQGRGWENGQPTALDLSLRVRGTHPVSLHCPQRAPVTHGQKRDSEGRRVYDENQTWATQALPTAVKPQKPFAAQGF